MLAAVTHLWYRLTTARRLMMARSSLRIFFVISSLISGTSAIFAHWDEELPFWDSPVQMGQNAQLRCIASDVDSQDDVMIEKIVETADNGRQIVSIATNQIVQEPYDRLGRYSALREIFAESNIQVMDLFISDADQRKHQSSASLAFVWGIHRGPVNSPHKGPVTRKMFPFDDVIMNGYTVGDDGGTYRCRVSSGDASEEKVLIVQAPLTSVTAFYRDSSGSQSDVTDGATITWSANDNERVGCKAFLDGGVDAPVLDVKIGGADVSHQFPQSPTIDSAQENSTIPNLYHFSMLAMRSSYQHPSSNYNGKTLECIGYTRGYESQKITKTYNLVVQAAPYVTCDESVHEPNLGDRLTASCTVTANPSPSNIMFKAWRANESDPYISTQVNGNMEVRGISINRMTPSGDDTDVTFTVNSIEEEDLGMTFELSASNSYGQNSYSFNITGDGGITSGCSTSSLSTFLVMATVAAILKMLLS